MKTSFVYEEVIDVLNEKKKILSNRYAVQPHFLFLWLKCASYLQNQSLITIYLKNGFDS
jgi:hypothetical protein